jgi:alanyl-tRNA synthetase
LSATGRHLSVQPPELAAAVEKLQNDSKELQKTIRLQQERLAGHEARALVERAQSAEARSILVEATDEWDAVGLKALASAATAQAPSLALALFTRSAPPVVVIAAGADSGVDASAALKALTAQFGGKGGGRRELAQGGGFAAPVDALLTAAHAALSR